MGEVLTPSLTPNVLQRLCQSTPARLGMGRYGSALPTKEVLDLAMSHARARDCVSAEFEVSTFAQQLIEQRINTLEVESAAAGRAEFIRNPNLGRRLSSGSRSAIQSGVVAPVDVAIIVADGLSTAAIERNAVPLLLSLLPRLKAHRLSLSPIVIARQARVALGDEIGEFLKAKLALILIGERPGLTSVDSLGAYLTFTPKVGAQDASRNCVSNIRPAGLGFDDAAEKIVWLIVEAIKEGQTGVALKDKHKVAQVRLTNST